jgi:hypothetical protein
MGTVPIPVGGPRRTATLPTLVEDGEVSRHLAAPVAAP